jgi:hypothetical protein
LVGSSPRLIATSYVLLRLLVPRHPPCALTNLATKMLASTVQFSRYGRNPAGSRRVRPQGRRSTTDRSFSRPTARRCLTTSGRSVPEAEATVTRSLRTQQRAEAARSDTTTGPYPQAGRTGSRRASRAANWSAFHPEHRCRPWWSGSRVWTRLAGRARRSLERR